MRIMNIAAAFDGTPLGSVSPSAAVSSVGGIAGALEELGEEAQMLGNALAAMLIGAAILALTDA